MDEPRAPDDENGTFEDGRAGDLPAPPQEEPPHWSLWLPYLVFRPALFFELFVIHAAPPLTILTSWLYGIVAVMDRIEARVLLSPRPQPLYELLRQEWAWYWLFSAGVGVFSGLLYYGIGGWWYRVRIKWCGIPDPDRYLARRVYIYASQAYVVPYLLYAAWETRTYSSPVSAASGDDPFGFLVVAALLWSVYVSYRGVRTAFDVRTWPTRWWFLILPGGLYTVLVVGVMGMVLFGGLSGRLEAPPDLGRPHTLEREGFSLRFPGNWHVDVDDEDYDPDASFSIGPTLADATISFWFYAEPMDSRACVDETVGNLESSFGDFQTTPVDAWGSFEGAGYRGRMTIDGSEYVLLTFCSTERDRPFEIMLVSEAATHDKLRPGFELVRDTFVLH